MSPRLAQSAADSGGPRPGRGYVNSRGEWVSSPTRNCQRQSASGCLGAVRDGTYSFSRSRRGTCSITEGWRLAALDNGLAA